MLQIWAFGVKSGDGNNLVVTEPEAPESYEFLLAAEVLMRENNLEIPITVKEALDFYIKPKYLFIIEMLN